MNYSVTYCKITHIQKIIFFFSEKYDRWDKRGTEGEEKVVMLV